MSELAFNATGESFEFPPEVTDLRTRRMKMRGAPELVYGRDGRPVTVPVTANIDELREAVGGVAGKYRLDPLNADGKLVEGVPAAYVHIIPLPSEPSGSVVAMPPPASGEIESVLRDAIRTNGELARTVISTFPSMMEAASRLIEAADGAGIPRRKPRYLEITDEEEDDDDADDDENDDVTPSAPTPGGFDINALVAQVVPVVVMGIMNGKFDLSKLGELLDWRKAAEAGKKAATASPSRGAAAATNARTPSESNARAATMTTAVAGSQSGRASTDEDKPLDPLDPAAMAHFLAIQSALTPDEAAVAREVASTLGPRELRAWLAELGPLSVADAVAVIRRHIGGQTSNKSGEVVS